MNTRIPAGRGTPPTKELSTDNNRRRWRGGVGITLTQPRTYLEIQLNGGEITQNKQLNKSKRESSKPCTHRKSSFNITCPHLHNRIQEAVDWVTLSLLAGGKDPPKKDTMTIKMQRHAESQHKWQPKTSELRRSRRLHHWISQVFYHRTSHQKPRESEQINLRSRG